jgi:hypothetical protein
MYDNDYNNDQSTKNINVSNEFVDIYTNFNVVTQVEKMKQLTKRELYLLLTVCLDKFSDEDPVVKHNLLPFKEEIMNIFDVQDDKEATDTILIDLITESGDKYIETDYIVYNDDQKLPDPLTKDQVRDAKINIINED